MPALNALPPDPRHGTREDEVSPMVLEGELLAHLDRQIASARRLLALVLEHGTAIRARDADAVHARLTDVQAEMAQQGTSGTEHARLLQRAGMAIAVPAGQVAELRGLLAKISREHHSNLALMRQERASLTRLSRLAGPEPGPDYRPRGAGAAQPRHLVGVHA